MIGEQGIACSEWHEPSRDDPPAATNQLDEAGKRIFAARIRLRDGSGIETPNASYALQMRFPATACVASLAMVRVRSRVAPARNANTPALRARFHGGSKQVIC